VVHTRSFRDCAPGGERVFTAEVGETFVFVHESGHRPFGLADEYCCDGGYFETEDNPDVYEQLSTCNADMVNLGNTSCRQIIASYGDNDDWYTSDPSGNDLMEDSGDHTAQPADRRRIEWIFNNCRSGSC
jgi:hypothetical protein